jgi:hypothetical protein
MKFEEEVVFFALLHKKLKKRHKFGSTSPPKLNVGQWHISRFMKRYLIIFTLSLSDAGLQTHTAGRASPSVKNSSESMLLFIM